MLLRQDAQAVAAVVGVAAAGPQLRGRALAQGLVAAVDVAGVVETVMLVRPSQSSAVPVPDPDRRSFFGPKASMS
ncbi:hypothetical protein ACIPWE_39215 [Streptomyces sp. NPDC090073]|uniref:hypothetical protein n=1 Tax=Streptomyces sp. NPDC090073 TaxID=3365936 RepID=UPI0037F5F906